MFVTISGTKGEKGTAQTDEDELRERSAWAPRYFQEVPQYKYNETPMVQVSADPGNWKWELVMILF